MTNSKKGPNRTLVIPGELIGEGDLKAGKNTYKRDNKIYASQMGFKTVNQNFVNVIALSGKYIPKPDDLVIGIIQQVSPTSWLVDVNSPYPAPLHVNEVPWRVDFGDTARYLKFGDTILARIFLVDEVKRIQVTMKDQGSRKLSGGQIIEVSPTKVPRVIGKGGSMISLIKQKTMCRLFVGQNGRIWIDGEPENIRVAVEAIRFIERESHRLGLTESVERYLEKVASNKGDADSIVPEIIPPEESRKRPHSPEEKTRREEPIQKDPVKVKEPVPAPGDDRKEDERWAPPKGGAPEHRPEPAPQAAPITPPAESKPESAAPITGSPKVESEHERRWSPPQAAKTADPVKPSGPAPEKVKEDEVAKILSTIPSPGSSSFGPATPTPGPGPTPTPAPKPAPAAPGTGPVSAPPLRPPVRPPAGPPQPPIGGPAETADGPPAGVQPAEQKPREQILKDEEFERMTE